MKRSSGFTLIETLISALILSFIAVSIYNGFAKITEAIRIVRIKQNAAALANEQFEIIRNLPYNDVGIINGLPSGVLPRTKTVIRDGLEFEILKTVRSVDQPFDGLVGEGDLSPADTKFVQVDIICRGCGDSVDSFSYMSQVAPKSLETSEGNGALFVRVFDADGQPVQGAEVNVLNNDISPLVDIDEITPVSGILQIVDAPPATGSYEISVTKDGFSSDRTYAIGGSENPVPHIPHANVAEGQVTQVSFAIDELSDVIVETTDALCQAVGNVDFSLTGSKTIGLNRFKYDEDLITNSFGEDIISDLEWDTYSVTIDDASYQLAGSNPTLPLTVNPGTEQTINLVLASSDTKGLLVQVIDAATGLPLSDATISIDNGTESQTEVTGQGFLRQTDWSGGSGQLTYMDTNEFSSESGIDFTTYPGQITLDEFGGGYVDNGELESSIFDIGTIANFHELSWQPGDQPVGVGTDPVKFQIATNVVLVDPDTGIPNSWTYLGPDGTGSTYYTSPGQTLSSVHDGSQFFRYKVFLGTDNTNFTPNISDISFTFSSDCVPTGEVLFQGLATDDYNISVIRSGYATQDVNDYVVNQDFQVLTVTMSQ